MLFPMELVPKSPHAITLGDKLTGSAHILVLKGYCLIKPSYGLKLYGRRLHLEYLLNELPTASRRLHTALLP